MEVPSTVSSSPPSDLPRGHDHPVGSNLPVPLDQTKAAVLTDDLKIKIIKQVEYYLSDENLPNDKFLLNFVSKNAEGYVPIGVIASFKKMKRLTRDTSLIVTALKDSTHLVVSSKGTKVKRLHPLSSCDIKDPMLCTVLVENLPDDHSLENLRRVFGKAGKVKNISIRDPHEACEPKKRTVAERLISGRLHAIVEYDTVAAAEKAAATLNNEQDWRFGLRVKLLKKGNKPGQKNKVWRESEPEKADKVHAPETSAVEENHIVHLNQKKKVLRELEHDKTDKVHTSETSAVEENHVVHLNHDSVEQHDSHDEEDVDHSSKEKHGVHLPKENNANKVRNRGRGRRQKYHVTNGHGHGTQLSSNHSFEPSKPPPGPKMPDGTRGFTMGRGKPLATN